MREWRLNPARRTCRRPRAAICGAFREAAAHRVSSRHGTLRERPRPVESGTAVAGAQELAIARHDLSARERLDRPRRRRGAARPHRSDLGRARGVSPAAARAARALDPGHRRFRGSGRLAHRGSGHQLQKDRRARADRLSGSADGRHRARVRRGARPADRCGRCSALEPRARRGADRQTAGALAQLVRSARHRGRLTGAGVRVEDRPTSRNASSVRARRAIPCSS